MRTDQRSYAALSLTCLLFLGCSSSPDAREQGASTGGTGTEAGGSGGSGNVATGASSSTGGSGLAGSGAGGAPPDGIKICDGGVKVAKITGDLEGDAQPWPFHGDTAATVTIVEDDGADGTSQSLKLTGSEATVDAPIGGYPADLSAFAGISFWAKTNDPSLTEVRINFPDIDSWPDAGVCSTTDNDTLCYNYHHTVIELTETWEQYTIDFSDLEQSPGFGVRKPFVDTQTIYKIFFDLGEAGVDMNVDEFGFTVCDE